MPDAYIATQDAVVGLNGNQFTIRRGVTRVVDVAGTDGADLLKQNPELFKPADQDAHFGTRTARSEPHVARKAAAKPAAGKAAKKAAASDGGSAD